MRTKKGFIKNLAGCLLICLVYFSRQPFAGEIMPVVPGTKISLTPPAGFVPAAKFFGYQQETRNASIMLLTLPIPSLTAAAEAFTKQEKLAQRGMVLLEKKLFGAAADARILLRMTQEAGGATLQKWILLFTVAEETQMVMATFPEQYAAELAAPLRAAVLSAQYHANAVADFFAGLNFRVTATEKLRFAKRLGNTLVLTRHGEFPQTDPRQPLVVVGSAVNAIRQQAGEDPAAARKRLAYARLTQYPDIKPGKLISAKPLKLAGWDCYYIRAHATTKQAAKPLALYLEQCMISTADSDYLFFATVGAELASEYQHDFQKILTSFVASKNDGNKSGKADN